MPAVTVGQIGLGQMGGNVAERLLDDGFDVVGFDVDEAALAGFEAAGGRPTDSNAAVAAEADVLLSALPSPEVVEAAYLGERGVLDGAHGDLICVEQSTTPPAPTRELASELADHGVDLLDAPFLGSPHSAREGTLGLPFGGERAAFEDGRVSAVADAMASQVHYLGESGSGKAAKLVNNCLSLGNSVLAYEALALGAALGLEVGALHEALRYGAGSSVALRVFVPAALNREFPPAFPIAYAQKDLRYARGAAEGADVPLPMAGTALEQYTAAAAMGHAAETAGRVVSVYEEWLGEPLEAEERVETPTEDPIFSR